MDIPAPDRLMRLEMCKSMKSESPVPLVDISSYLNGSDPSLVAQEVASACETIGFLLVIGHGFDPNLLAEMERVTKDFFRLPEAEKQRVAPPAPDVFRGFRSMSRTALARSLGEDTQPDLVESFVVNRPDDDTGVPDGLLPGHDRFHHPNIWPAVPADMVSVWSSYYGAMTKLAEELMRIFALALDLPKTWFDSLCDRHRSNLLANYYPPQLEAPFPGQLRRGAHSDYGSLTVLHADDPRGLQVLRRDSWVDVPVVEGAFIVNIGDLMQRWTNNRWVSTMHRVVNPPADTNSERLSIPFFHTPNLDVVIDCIPTCVDEAHPCSAEPVTTGDWFLSKHLPTVTS